MSGVYICDGRRFNSLAAATKYAGAVFNARGIILGIELKTEVTA